MSMNQPNCHGCGGRGWVTNLYGSVQVCIICAGTGVAKAEFVRPKPSVPIEGPFVSRDGTDCSKQPPWIGEPDTSGGTPPVIKWGGTPYKMGSGSITVKPDPNVTIWSNAPTAHEQSIMDYYAEHGRFPSMGVRHG